jgi:hypothetical protein
MRPYYKYILMAVFCMTGVSCKKYLDVAPDNVGTLDYAFRNRNEAESYLFSCYSTMQQLNNVIYDAGFTTSAEIIYPNNLTANFFDQSGFQPHQGCAKHRLAGFKLLGRKRWQRKSFPGFKEV